MDKTLLKSYVFSLLLLLIPALSFSQLVEVESMCIDSSESIALRKWKVTNISPNVLNGTIILGGSFAEVFSLAIGESKDYTFDTSTGTATTVRIISGKSQLYSQDFPDANICASVDNLPVVLTGECTLNPTDGKLVWQIENPNDIAIRLNYILQNGENTLNKNVWVQANQTKTFKTPAIYGGNMAYSTNNGFSDTLIHAQERCTLEGITFTNVCTNNKNKNRWRIENPNDFGFSVALNDGSFNTIWVPKAGNGQDIDGNPKSGNYKFFHTSKEVTSLTITYGNSQSLSSNYYTGPCSDNKLDTLSCEAGKRSFLLSNAVSDGYHNGDHNHSIYLSNFNGGDNAKLTFDGDAYLVYNTDGKKAYIHGNATMTTGNLAGSRWVVYAPFEQKASNTVPKKELKGNAYDPNDGGVDTDSWFYFLMKEGSFMRQLDGDGYITMNTMPADGRYGLQIGKGANGKNINKGASSWFFYCYNGQPAKQGDFNLDLAENCDDLTACSIFYIDNATDLIYLVNPKFVSTGTSSRNIQSYNTISLQPYFTSPYRDAHMALNVEGTKLYVFESKGPEHNYGYFDLASKIFRPLGVLNIEGGLVQASFNPYGQLYISSTSANEIFVMDNPDVPNSQVSYGSVKIAGTNKVVNIAGADMAFDKDGSFFLATHGHGGAIFTVSGLANHLVARRVGSVNTQGKITGLAIMEAGGGSLLYSSKDALGMYMVHLDDPDNHEFLPFDSTFTQSAWGDMTTACMEPIAPCDGCFASNVIAFNQGKKKNGGNVPSNRSNPVSAVGQPQESDTYNFVSLGFGGSIELELPCPVYNHNKNGVLVGNNNSIDYVNGDGYSTADFIIVETSFGKMNVNCGINQNQNYPERCLVYGKEALGDDWVLLTPTPVCRTSFIDIGPAVENGDLSYVKYIKIEDQTDPVYHNGDADGYDVDGLIVCPDLVIGAITGEGRSGLVNARTSKNDYVFDFNRITDTPDDELLSELKAVVYPNPTNGEVSLDISSHEQEVAVRIYDNTGRLVFKAQAYEFMQQEVNLAWFGKGIFIVQVFSGEKSEIIKVLVK